MLNTKDLNKAALSHIPAMRRMFKRMGLTEDRIDDAVQIGYLALVTKELANWRGKNSLECYCLQVARCRFVDHTRTHASKVSQARELMPSETGDFADDCTRHITDHRATVAVSNAMDLRALYQAIDTCEGRVKAVAESYARLGELKAVAAELGISHATVCRVFNREVLPRLREILAD